MSQAVRTIRREHRDYSQVLECLCRLLDRLEEPGGNKRRRLLFLILDYVEAFPATFHHPEEQDHLFAALRRRQPDYGPLLDRLHDEHAQALDLLAEPRAACLAWRRDGVSLPAPREDDPLFGAPARGPVRTPLGFDSRAGLGNPGRAPG